MSAERTTGGSSPETGFAAMWSADGVTRSLDPTAPGLPSDLPFLFTAGQQLGPYLIVRPIGKGGMGQVYEAEETESGRRVAVKILSRGLGDDEARAGFLNEGQLAASLSHPNCVYVFGTSEVQGFPVIAMELAPAGTLKELVIPGTPLSPAAAVDAILQVIAGLEAAAALGILHRDIKPSNCFVDGGGRVMVGDFGLSMTTGARDEGSGWLPNTILGTPGFASPEQLRGDRLDLQSDIYSVGATLYYLLAGNAPFDDPDIRSLIARVATEPAPPLGPSRPDVVPRLASVVARCLAKQPGERHASYAALAAALEPFRSASLTPASLGRRFLAGGVDSYVAALPVVPLNLYIGTRFLLSENGPTALLAVLPGIAVSMVYYAILEGRFGCAAGKAILNLRVIEGTQSAPGFRRALVRSLLFILPAQLLNLAIRLFLLPVPHGATSGSALDNGATSLFILVMSGMNLACLGLLFSTARRRNGYAALHDLATDTRVVLRPKPVEAVEALRHGRSSPRSGQAGDVRIGPYLVGAGVKAGLSTGSAALVVEAFDDRLRRGVWVELLPPGTPPLAARRRDLGRPARTRWLSGRRDGDDCWDAYEAIEGQPLLDAIARPQPWARVRHWLADLAHEVAIALKDGSLPELDTDRIWIGDDGRARLLDWPPPGREANRRLDRPPSIPDFAAAQRFLYGVTAGALRGLSPAIASQEPPVSPLPMPARALLLALRDGALTSAEALDAQSAALLRSPAVFPRGRRAMQLAISAFLPIVLPLVVVLGMRFQRQAQTSDPAAFQLKACASRLAALAKNRPSLTAAELEQREAIEIYIAEHLQQAVEVSAVYARTLPGVNSLRVEHDLAARAIASHPQRSPEQIRKADDVVSRLLVSQSTGLAALSPPRVQWAMSVFLGAWLAAVVAVLALIGAVAARGGATFRLCGGALVTRDGARASRLRALWRAIVTWSPVPVALVLTRLGPRVQEATVASALVQTAVLVPLAAGAVWALLHPSRGIQDRLAGTWIVPR